jgi:hypothetical protein
MSDLSITRLGPISKSGDATVQPSRGDAGSKHRRHQPEPEPEPAGEPEDSEEQKHDLDRLA